MKLLIISGDRMLASGKRGASFNTMEEFHKHWERIDFICPNVGKENGPSELFGNMFLHPSPYPLIFQPFHIFWKGKELFEKNQFDVMTVHEYPPFYNGIGAIMLSRAIGVPFMLEVHHIPGYPRAASTKERVYAALTRMLIAPEVKYAKAVRVVNRNQAADFLVSAGVPMEKIEYIPSLYIDLKTFYPLDIPKRYDLAFVGRLSVNKGIQLFLDTVRQLNCSGVIVGDGDLKDTIKSEIENRKLKIDFRGWAKDASEVAKIMNESRILVMPSYNEGGPRVVVEAMACGIPILATPVGVVPDVIEDEGGGIIIKWDVDDIVVKARRLLNDDGLYSRCRESAIATAQQFERSRAITKYAEAVKNII